jgi:RNase P subunit RPR2
MAEKEPGSSIDDNTAKPENNSEKNLSKPDSVPEDKITFWCTECGQKYRLPKELAGKTGVCYKCHNYMYIPGESQKKPLVNKAIIFPCKYCGKKIRKLRKLIGTKVKCGECGAKNVVPEKSQISSLAKSGTPPEDRILFWCAYCGQKYRLPGHLAGKPGNCDRCHNDFIIPQKSQDKPRLKKTVVFPCAHCGSRQWKETELIGKEIECHKCGAKNIVPEDRDVSLLVKKEDLIRFWCGHCGQKYRLPREMGGKAGVCDVCHNDLHIPAESQDRPERKETIVFPCEYCGVKLRKSKESAGKKTHCISCGREIIVPEKSKRSLIEIIAPGKKADLFAVAEATKMNLYIPQKMQAAPAPVKPEEKAAARPETPEKKTGPKEIPVKIVPPAGKDREPDDRILFWCGYCGQKYRLPKEYAGKKSSCDICRNDFFIPLESQGKPEKFKDALVFQCEHCGKKQWRPGKLAGTQTACTECGEENTVPTVSKTSLLEKVTPVKLRDAFIVTEATRTDLVVVGRPVSQKREPSEKEQSAAKFHRPKPSEDDILETHLGHPAAQTEPEIIITEDPPTIHKIKNYFQQKAEKYLIFAVFVVFMDYLINAYGDGKRPSKTFILFSTFATSAIILLGAWNYATYQPPDKTSKCRYNVKCTNPKCKYEGIIRSEKVIEEKCPKCGNRLGLVYRCRECGGSFVYDEIASKKELKAHNFRIAQRKAKWHGGRPKVEDTMASSRVVKKCPQCRSEDVYYVTVKQAEKEAAEKEAKAEMEKQAKKGKPEKAAKGKEKKKK